MKILLPLLVLLAAFIFWKAPKKSTPFSLEAIQADIPFHAQWASRALSEEENRIVQDALSQSYHYLGSGGQCFAFVSADDRYVIKFFKQKAFAIDPWITRFPIPLLIDWLKEKKIEKKAQVRNSVFNAFKHCFEHLAKETGMLYIHLNRTSHLNKTLTLTDAKGIAHQILLDDLEFALQKKAEPAFKRIDALMKANDVNGAKKAVSALLKLNLTLSQKGYRNRDPNFRSNCGFIGEEAIVFDVGRIVLSEQNSKAELKKSAPRLRKYLKENHPQLIDHFETCLEEI